MATQNLRQVFRAVSHLRRGPISLRSLSPSSNVSLGAFDAHFRHQINAQTHKFAQTHPFCTTVVPDVYGVEWPEHEYVHFAEECLESISEHISTLAYATDASRLDFDVELSQGVLTLSLGTHGTYVLNTQTPNRQIWMSSPQSGPWRYGWNAQEEEWVSTRDGHLLTARLNDELSSIFEQSVEISFTGVDGVSSS